MRCAVRGLLIPMLIGAASMSAVAQVESIQVVALFEDKAMLSIDGKNVVLSEGDKSPQGITLVEADQFHAVIEYQGQREDLTLSSGNVLLSPDAPVGAPDPGEASLVLYSDTQGMFHTSGRINGTTVRFVVDTGATTVALSGAMARRIGLNYQEGEMGFAQTASGVARSYGITLDRIQIGAITMRYVPAAVVEGNFPVNPLLGMSFLGTLDMQRSGNRMELKSR
jgi:aspartyl protease family protein